MNLTGTGLMEMGHCPVSADDGLPHSDGTLILLGPDEPDFWPLFTNSDEYADGGADPLDRWSRRTIDQLATDAGGVAYYPFGGAPFHPFFTWAQRTGRFWASPIGFLVHDVAGLFASFRGGIWLPEDRVAATANSPCEGCAAPCRTACPVDAFSQGYDVAACKDFLQSDPKRTCLSEGCQARRACPVGAERRLDAQAAFHMEAFI